MNNKPKFLMVMICAAFTVISFEPVQAEMFKCVKTSGDVFYNDKPCPINEKETLIKADKAPKNAYIPSFTNNEEGSEAVRTRNSVDANTEVDATNKILTAGKVLQGQAGQQQAGGSGSGANEMKGAKGAKGSTSASKNGTEKNSPKQADSGNSNIKTVPTAYNEYFSGAEEPMNVNELVLRQGAPQ